MTASILRRPGRVAVWALLLGFAAVQLTPFYLALTVALKPRTDLSSRWLPPTEGLFLGNFERALDRGHMLTAIGNSVVVTFTATLLVCVLGAMASYPLARRRTRLNGVVLLCILGSLMIPPLSILVPLYSMMARLDAVNTRWGIVLVMVSAQLPLSVFLYSAFIRTIPLSLEEAARLDGAGHLGVFWFVVLPLLKPVTATVAILTGVFIWNDYQLSLYMLTTSEMRTIAPAIGSFFSQQSSNLGAAAAASLLGLAPILVAYVFLQRYFMKGMLAGAEKG